MIKHVLKEQKTVRQTKWILKQAKNKFIPHVLNMHESQKRVIWTQPCDVWWCYLANADARLPLPNVEAQFLKQIKPLVRRQATLLTSTTKTIAPNFLTLL